jgi:S1/P1 Nuclease
VKRFLSILLLVHLFMPTHPASAWGDKGHRTVGRIAELFLQEWGAQTAQNRIGQILKSGETLSSVATWADTVKRGQFGPTATNPDSDTQAFRRDTRNQNNRYWHFVDLPLDCTSYQACDAAPTKFTTSDDIVHMIKASIRVLQPGGPTPPRFSKRNALRLLVHLVGDLQQPLHVGSGYINPDGPGDSILIVRAPLSIKQNGFDSDHGANHLLLGGNAESNLHSHWDGDLVDQAAGSMTVPDFAAALKMGIAVQPSWDGWAGPHVGTAVGKRFGPGVCRQAYNSVMITNAVVIDDPESDQVRYAITMAANYDNTHTEVVKTQVVKSGYRLAKLPMEILQ